MTGRSRVRLCGRIEAIAAAGEDSRTLRRNALEVLRAEIGFDAYVWLLTDPASTVGTAPLAEVPCLPELPRLIKWKYATTVNRWTELLTRACPAARLHDALGGDLAASRVWAEVMSRYGIRDVASLVFADRFGCWGFLDLWRADPHPPFDAAAAEALAEVAPILTTALRSSQAATFNEAATPPGRGRGPVVLTLDDDLTITSRTAASQDWLDRLLPSPPDGRGVPASVYNVAAQLLATEAGVDHHPAMCRAHLTDGLWLTMRAARLETSAGGPPLSAGEPAIVVTIEESSAAERLDLFSRSFGLSPRENDLLALLATGSDTRGMARAMSVSENTIQDHVTAIFDKTHARDRVTILSRALGTRPRGPV